MAWVVVGIRKRRGGSRRVGARGRWVVAYCLEVPGNSRPLLGTGRLPGEIPPQILYVH